MSPWSHFDAERAFSQVARARRRAAMLCRLRPRRASCGCLPVLDARGPAHRGGHAGRGVRAIPLDAIGGTVEPNRAREFDPRFRPSRSARSRWQRIWLAEARGTVLPPISVVQVGDRYAIRDGHHRVSVARARGALSIDAIVSLS